MADANARPAAWIHLTAAVVALLVAWLMMDAALAHNPQGEFCDFGGEGADRLAECEIQWPSLLMVGAPWALAAYAACWAVLGVGRALRRTARG